MTKILILGAHGATAQLVSQRLLAETDVELVLFLRDANRLKKLASNQWVTLIDGNVQDLEALQRAMTNVDVVYSNVGGPDLATSTAVILQAMTATKRTRLIFYSALGALHEVPGKFGEWNEQAISAFLPGFRKSNQLIQAASPAINTTQLRPAWLTDHDEIDYEVTGVNDLFKGTEVSRQSVADLIIRLIKDPQLYPDTSIGIDKAGTDGDKPSWL